MLTGVAFCPQAPVLVPPVARAAAPELDALRAACRTAIRRIARPGVQLIVVGGGAASTRYEPSARGTFAGFGVALDVPLGADEPAGPPSLPGSLTVGAWLLRDALGPNCGAIGYSIGSPGDDLPDVDGAEYALVVLGDGSACRSVKAPGYLDERAADFDGSIASALRRGDGALLRCAQDVATELLAGGALVWDVVGRNVGSGWDAELLYDDAPYGVGYFVAAWRRR